MIKYSEINFPKTNTFQIKKPLKIDFYNNSFARFNDEDNERAHKLIEKELMMGVYEHRNNDIRPKKKRQSFPYVIDFYYEDNDILEEIDDKDFITKEVKKIEIEVVRIQFYEDNEIRIRAKLTLI